MNLEQKTRIYRKIAIVMAIVILFDTARPTVVLALTSGPTQPEFSSFEPVATTNMVNEFSGDFTYNLPALNIPGANGGGYALSLSYHSGTSPEEEASWVGYGWTLNPGAIVRNKRGFPDDYKGSSVTFHNDVPANWTASIGGSANFEIFSYDVPASLSASIRYNNYKGVGYTAGAGLSFANGLVSLGYSVSDGDGSFSAAINPAGNLNSINKKSSKDIAAGKEIADKLGNGDLKKKNLSTEQAKQLRKFNKHKASTTSPVSLFGSNYGIFSFGDAVRTANTAKYNGNSFNVSISFIPTPTQLEAGVSFAVNGNYSIQTNEASESLNAYGYMYSGNATESNSPVMDYYVEKDIPFYKRNKFLGIPFSNADNFAVTGEGLGGGFRIFNNRAGHFRPSYKESSTMIYNVGAELEAGLNLGGGGDLGVGRHTLKVNKWPDENNINTFSFSSASSGDEPVFFRFNNDLGGNVRFAGGNDLVSASIQTSTQNFYNAVPGVKEYRPTLSPNINQLFSTGYMNQGARSGRSSYIAYHTNSEMASNSGVRAYSKQNYINGLVDRTNAISDGIGEIVTFNEEGNRYTYGLPVFSRNESSLQYDLKGLTSEGNRYIVHKDISQPRMKVGEENNNPYATSFLLTEITTPDYVDRGTPGPNDDDFGGWTRFEYDRVHGSYAKSGSSSDWYRWRVPYNGLLYQKGSLSDPDDDMGTVVKGEKEIYYLKYIETKTHIAVFETSSRLEGLDANHNENNAALISNSKGNKTLKKLDKIKLYRKKANWTNTDYGTLIKTIHLKYDYSLMQGIPNTNGTGTDGGKLTLEKVWFEYEGKSNAKISPYTFKYEYPVISYPAPYGLDYSDDKLNGMQNYMSGANQNPSYSDSKFLDSWGNYQYDGVTRHGNLQHWVSQSVPSSLFDPAAWQLKVIQLPSGGEIHVQYEQKDYSYVQDRMAMSLVSLTEDATNGISDDVTNNKYYINPADLGINSSVDISNQRQLLNNYFQNSSEKIFFKFLYRLKGSSIPLINECGSEYISGYAKVKSVGGTGNQIFIELENGNNQVPREVCKDFVRKERALKSVLDGACNAQEVINNNGDAKDIVMQLSGMASQIYGFFSSFAGCVSVDFTKSYFKVPMLKDKKGGGVRVKRLLMYDEGIEGESGDDAALYGSEYIYETLDEKNPLRGVISSGVAVNEPLSAREDHTLVGFLPRFSQSMLDKIVSGRFKDDTEGPIGESILPGASIGYSKVTVKNIYSGKTNTGFTVNEFYTAKDYPFDKHYPSAGGKAIEMTELNEEKDRMIIPSGLFNYNINNVWLTQGFRFIINSMHGQPKSMATYTGDYSNVNDPNKIILSSQQVFTYFEPGENVPMFTGIDQPLSPAQPGKEMEVVFETKAVEDILEDANIEGDIDVGIFLIPLPFGSAFPSLTYSESRMNTHTTSKIIRYPAIQKSVLTYQDGIYHRTDNIAFNPETGKPLITKTTDGFDNLALQQSPNHNGEYLTYTFPASQQHKEMSQRAMNERATIGGSSLTITANSSNCTLTFSGSGVCDALNKLTPGDLVLIGGSTYHIGAITGNSVQIFPTGTNTTCPSGTVNAIEVIKSGRTNQLNASVGSVTTYGVPLQQPMNVPIPSALLTQRQNFVNALNAAIDAQATTVSYTGTAQIIDPKTGYCITFDPSKLMLSYKGNTDVTVSIETKGSNSIPVGIDSHELVADLNNWLDAIWGLNAKYDFTNISSYYFSDDYCDKPYYAFIANDQNLIQEIEDKKFITYIKNKYYDIEGYNQLMQGKDFLTFNPIVAFNVFRNEDFANFWSCVLDFPTSSHFSFVNSILQMHGCSSGDGHADSYNHAYVSYGASPSADICHIDYNFHFPNQDPDPFQNNSALFTFFNTNQPFTEKLGKFHNDENGWLYFERFETDNCSSITTMMMQLDAPTTIPPEYCDQTFESGGTFTLNPNTGDLEYTMPCYTQAVNCIKFCPAISVFPYSTMNNVLAANVQTFSDNWLNTEDLFALGSGNVYEKGAKGKWRQEMSCVYKTTVIGGAKDNNPMPPVERSYNNAGVFDDFTVFNWQYPAANNTSKWLPLNKVTRYSPDGNALEEENILGIKSAAKFGYNQTVPYLVAQNADYGSVQFESFENIYWLNGMFSFEDGLVKSNAANIFEPSFGHSGKMSLKIPQGVSGTFSLKPFKGTEQLNNSGLSVKVWVKPQNPNDNLEIKLRLGGLYQFDFNMVAQTGEWRLYEAKVPGNLLGIGSNVSLGIMLSYPVTNIWIDDVRVQPLDAQVNCYVYDVNTLRLLTSFDDQHFGLYYQYNGEGKLVRKLIETERGLKTIQETQYNTPLTVNRPATN